MFGDPFVALMVAVKALLHLSARRFRYTSTQPCSYPSLPMYVVTVYNIKNNYGKAPGYETKSIVSFHSVFQNATLFLLDFCIETNVGLMSDETVTRMMTYCLYENDASLLPQCPPPAEAGQQTCCVCGGGEEV